MTPWFARSAGSTASRGGRAGADVRGPTAAVTILQTQSGGVRSAVARFRAVVRRALFRRRLDRLRMRDLVDVKPPREVYGIPALSGAFHAGAARAVDRTGGFDPSSFFISRTMIGACGSRALRHRVCLQCGSSSSAATRGKGWRHVRWFLESAYAFIGKHGLEVVLTPLKCQRNGNALIVVTARRLCRNGVVVAIRAMGPAFAASSALCRPKPPPRIWNTRRSAICNGDDDVLARALDADAVVHLARSSARHAR